MAAATEGGGVSCRARADAAADPDGGSSGVRAGPTDRPAERAKQDRPLPHVLGLDGDRDQAGLGEMLLLEQLLDPGELVEGVSEDVGGGHSGYSSRSAGGLHFRRESGKDAGSR